MGQTIQQRQLAVLKKCDEANARLAAIKQTKYFSATTTYNSLDAHKAAQAFLQEMRSQGYAGFESTYGNHGYSVTYWPIN